jgi:two-component system, OmpR family, heavy metal sensor histidine kinase CusS
VADPQGKFQGVLNEFYSVLYIALPIVLVIAALGGHWLSSRALGPVDQIIDEARAIDPANLAARLSVPASGDELQRLSETLNQMLGRVERSVQQVRRFTADASHELRAPMTLIYTAAQFALKREHSTDGLKEALRKVLREAKRCTELINQLLWLARSDAGSSRIELAPADIAALTGDVVNAVTVLAINKGLKVFAVSPETPIRALIEEASFRRMLLTLLDNAIKYTPSGGSIAVRVMEDVSEVVIAIEDTGAGILPEELPFIFDHFWRDDKVRSRDAGGTGLGLAIAREIAEQHHAKLTVESSVGHGSTFTVRVRREAGERLTVRRTNEQPV